MRQREEEREREKTGGENPRGRKTESDEKKP